MNIEQMTEQLQAIILSALQKAQEKGNPELSIEHILNAMLEDDSLDGIWKRMDLSKQELAETVKIYLDRLPGSSQSGQPVLNRYVNEANTHALSYMKRHDDTYMSSGAFLIGMFETKAPVIEDIRRRFSISAKGIEAAEDE